MQTTPLTESTSPTPRKSFRSLTVTIAIAFTALTIFVLVFSSALELYFSFEAHKTVVGTHQEMLAQDAANTTTSFLNEKFATLEQAAIINNLGGSVERRDLVLDTLLKQNPFFRQLLVVDPTGKELERVSRLSVLEPSPLEKYKESMLSEVGKGNEFISPIYIDDATSEPLVLIATATRDLFGNVQGAFAAELNLKFLWNLVADIQLPEGGVAYAVDENGTLIAYRDVSRVLRHENLSALPEVQEFLNSKGAQMVMDSSMTMVPYQDPIITGKGILGTTVLSTHTALGFPKWSVMVETPFFSAYAGLQKQLAYMFLVLIFSIVLAAISGVYLSRRITRPLKELRDIIIERTSGNLGVRVRVVSNDEIGTLASSFNYMASQLELSYKQLNEEKARLLASINSLSLGFIIADLNHTVLLMNEAVRGILGLRGGVSGGSDGISGIFGHEFDIKAEAQQSIKNKKIVVKEIVSGNKFLRYIIAPIITHQDREELIGYVLILEDITERKVLERGKEEFFSIASHELRTPLTAIRGNASLLGSFYAGKIKDKGGKQMIADILVASDRLIGIVNDFLNVSRLEQGRLVFKKEPCDIAATITDSIKEIAPVAAKKNIKVTFQKLAPAPPLVLADKDRVKEVLVNLIGNAIHYTEKGSITITVAKVEGFVKVSVSDTGTGIPPELQSLLFRKFQQAGKDQFTRDVSQGTGLGLYISKLIVEGLGGTIALEESRPGKGSIFSFTLPLASVPLPRV